MGPDRDDAGSKAAKEKELVGVVLALHRAIARIRDKLEKEGASTFIAILARGVDPILQVLGLMVRAAASFTAEAKRLNRCLHLFTQGASEDLAEGAPSEEAEVGRPSSESGPGGGCRPELPDRPEPRGRHPKGRPRR